MNQDTVITEPSSEPIESASSAEAVRETEICDEEYPFYIVPRPPVPGKTAWSLVPW